MNSAQALIDAYIDDDLDDAGFAKLCDWLRADASNRRAFARALAVHAGITEWSSNRSSGVLMPELAGLSLAGESDDDPSDWLATLAQLDSGDESGGPVDLTEAIAQQEDAARRDVASRRAKTLARRRANRSGQAGVGPLPVPMWAVVGAMAAVLVVAVSLFMYFSPSSHTGPATAKLPLDTDGQAVVLARVVDQFRPQGAAAFAPGNRAMNAGQYHLDEGSVRLRLTNDTEIKLIAPVRFELSQVGQITLHQGELVAQVPEHVSGFRVHTPSGVVVNQAQTTFGVDVLDHKTTEVEVMHGRISIAARSTGGAMSDPVELAGDRAARMSRVSGRVEPIQAGGDRFSMDYVRVIDLVDAVAGGDGTTGMRNAGIDPQTGDWQDAPIGESEWGLTGDQRFHSVGACALIAGTFIPSGLGQATQIDPAGHTFDQFTVTHHVAYGQTWAGGYVPVPGAQPELDTIIEDVNYAAASRGLIRMHANSGLCFDLEAMRVAHPGLTTTRFRTGLSNREGTRREPGDAGLYASVDVWVFVDGKLRYSRSDITTADGLLDIDLPLEANDQYLTVVITDALNTNTFDWVLLCQPRIDLRPSDRE